MTQAAVAIPVLTEPVADPFRVYDESSENLVQKRVMNHYRKMRQNQTLEYVLRMKSKYSPLDNAEMTIWEAFDALGDYVDASDPDTELPNIVHMFQTAERIRANGEPEWMQVVGLIHDLGKALYKFSNGAVDGQDGLGGDQWGIAGDTFLVGCRIPDCTILPQFNTLNPDMTNPEYNTPNGIYQPGCGMDNTHCAFGHDEYMYMVLKNHAECTLPAEGLAIVRFHSMYPWHAGGAYEELMTEADFATREVVRRFQSYDLYTKHGDVPDVDALRPYYEALVNKFIPGKLKF